MASSGSGIRQQVTLGNRLYERQPDGSYREVARAQTAPKIVGGKSAADPYLILQDGQGNQQTVPNPNYQPRKPDVLAPNTAAPYVVGAVPDGSGGFSVTAQPNPNQITVSDAVLGLYESLKPLVQGGQVPLEVAKTLLTEGYQAYQARIAQQNADETARRDTALADETVRRGNLDAARAVGDTASRMAEAANQSAVAPGTTAFVRSQLAGSGGVAALGPLTRLPYDPSTFAANAAASALAHLSQAARDHLSGQGTGQPGEPMAPTALATSAGQQAASQPYQAGQPGQTGGVPWVSSQALAAQPDRGDGAQGAGHTINITIGGPRGAQPTFTAPTGAPPVQPDQQPALAPPNGYRVPQFAAPTGPMSGPLMG